MDKKISELDQALQINNDAVFPISQDNGGTDTTYKVSITQLSSEVGEDQTFSNLQTSSKKLVGAINELYQGGGGGGSSTLDGLNDVDIDDQTLSDGQVLKYDSAEDKWVNDDVGAGGHTIVADDGTDLTQRANLQFIGAYSEDNSVDDTTEVNVVRNMTKAQFDQLTADEKTGFINTTDETSQIYATEIPMSALDSDTVAEKLDEKVDTADYTAELLPIESGSATNTKAYIDSKTDIKSLVTFNENISGTNTNILVKCGVLYIYYQGEAKSHSVNDLLFTLPSGYRPGSLRYCTYNINDSAFGEVGIDTDGKCYINHISTSGANGRVYFAVAIPL